MTAAAAGRDTIMPSSIDGVRDAVAAAVPLRILGAGTWANAGRGVEHERTLSLAALAGVVDHVPGDLTMTARAGTPLRVLHAAAAAEGQMLPLDPWGGDDGTLGATLATAAAGPQSAALGLPRDVVLGVQAVTGTGDAVRGGGRVVKNVAGFDLVRLMIGAWGTLGVLTEATVRLRAIPEADATLAIAIPHDRLGDALATVQALSVGFAAAELLDDACARLLALPDGARLLVRLRGNADAVRAQRAQAAALGDATDAAADAWDRLRTLEPRAASVARLSARPADLATPWTEAGRVAAAARERGIDAWAHASVARGVVRLVVEHDASHDAAVADAFGPQAPPRVSRIFERLPAALWPALAPPVADDALSRDLRRAFDPQAILNRGVLGASPAVPA